MKHHKEATDEVVKKAKAEIEKVQKIVESTKVKNAQELEAMRSEMLMKHQKADENREKRLEQVKQTAQEVGQRRSASKDMAPKADE